MGKSLPKREKLRIYPKKKFFLTGKHLTPNGDSSKIKESGLPAGTNWEIRKITQSVLPFSPPPTGTFPLRTFPPVRFWIGEKSGSNF